MKNIFLKRILKIASGILILGVIAFASIAMADRTFSLPDQTGNSGKFLQTNGTNPLWATAGSGTVTSVGLTMPSGFTVANSPVTSSGTINVTTSLNGLLLGTGSGLTTATVGNGLNLATGTLSNIGSFKLGTSTINFNQGIIYSIPLVSSTGFTAGDTIYNLNQGGGGFTVTNIVGNTLDLNNPAVASTNDYIADTTASTIINAQVYSWDGVNMLAIPSGESAGMVNGDLIGDVSVLPGVGIITNIDTSNPDYDMLTLSNVVGTFNNSITLASATGFNAGDTIYDVSDANIGSEPLVNVVGNNLYLVTASIYVNPGDSIVDLAGGFVNTTTVSWDGVSQLVVVNATGILNNDIVTDGTGDYGTVTNVTGNTLTLTNVVGTFTPSNSANAYHVWSTISSQTIDSTDNVQSYNIFSQATGNATTTYNDQAITLSDAAGDTGFIPSDVVLKNPSTDFSALTEPFDVEVWSGLGRTGTFLFYLTPYTIKHGLVDSGSWVSQVFSSGGVVSGLPNDNEGGELLPNTMYLTIGTPTGSPATADMNIYGYPQ